MGLFLRLKAWQMFLLVTLPLVIMILLISFVPNPEHFAKFGGFITWLWIAIGVGWLYSVGVASNLRLPPSLQKNPTVYRLGFVYAVAFTALLYGYVMPHITSEVMASIRANTAPQTPPWYVWIFPLNLLALAAMFYGLWFTAKQFATLQRQQELGFLDYIGPFFLFWFAPIGVWFLQPKINALLGSDGES